VRFRRTERFQFVTNNFDAISQATFKTDQKHAKDRFSLLSKLLEALDKKYATNTGTEEVLTPMELLLPRSTGSSGGGVMKPSPMRRRARPEDVDDAEFVAVLLRRD